MVKDLIPIFLNFPPLDQDNVAYLVGLVIIEVDLVSNLQESLI